MQTLNLIDNRFSEFNAFSPFNSTAVNNKTGLQLLEQLQTSLEIDILLNKFAITAARLVDFSGLKFQSANFKATAKGSRMGKKISKFDLVVENERLGALYYSLNHPLSSADYKILTELHHYLLYPLKNAIAYQSALKLAMQDGLTNLGNRRYFDQQLQRIINKVQRSGGEVGLIIGDLNKFKVINDTYGHATGDLVLTQFAQALTSSVRDSDSVYRFGGDEFAILVEDASKESLALIENRINQAINQDPLLTKFNVSCSLGATFMNRSDDAKSFYDRADKALYRRKFNMNHGLCAV